MGHMKDEEVLRRNKMKQKYKTRNAIEVIKNMKATNEIEKLWRDFHTTLKVAREEQKVRFFDYGFAIFSADFNLDWSLLTSAGIEALLLVGMLHVLPIEVNSHLTSSTLFPPFPHCDTPSLEIASLKWSSCAAMDVYNEISF